VQRLTTALGCTAHKLASIGGGCISTWRFDVGKNRKTNLVRWVALIIILAAAVAFIVLGQQHEPGMTVVATVKGNPIYLFELEREIKNQYDQMGGNASISDDNIDELRVAVLDMLIEQKTVLLDAAANGYKPNTAEVDASLAEQKKQAGSLAAWEAFLSSWGFTEATFRQYLIDMYTIDNYPKTRWNVAEVTEEMLYQEYLRRKESSPNLVYEEAKDFIRTTMEIDAELRASTEWFKALKGSTPVKINDQRYYGRRAFYEKDYKSAISHYMKARKSDRLDPYIDITLAKSYAALDDMKNAVKYFESAVKKDDQNEFLYMAMARIYFDKGMKDEAAAQLRKAIATVDATNLALLERVEEIALDLDMDAEADQLDAMIRKLMLPSWGEN